MAYLPSVILSCCDKRWGLSGEGRLLEWRYSMESLSYSVPELLNITHGKSFLLGGPYPLEES
jgi:hypothetical protein